LDSSASNNDAAEPAPTVSSDVRHLEVAEPESKPDRRWVFFSILAAMLIIDQAIKYWAESHLHVTQSSVWPWPGVLEMRLTHNQGIAFGLAQGKGWLFTPIALLISCGATLHSWRHPWDGGWMHAAMALLTAGALGNLFDRLVFQYVRDMFATRFMNFPVFNWADACITVATAILILIWSKEAIDSRSKPHPSPEMRRDSP